MSRFLCAVDVRWTGATDEKKVVADAPATPRWHPPNFVRHALTPKLLCFTFCILYFTGITTAREAKYYADNGTQVATLVGDAAQIPLHMHTVEMAV